ncbi:MAG TPA: hypothetical protein VEZ17_15405 [Chitinophagaceae bacterium]|nr:hypothetical protein [Chitinophagaceae bacterium]
MKNRVTPPTKTPEVKDLHTETLVQVREALEEVEEARGNSRLSMQDKLNLESASVQLRNIERAIIRQKEEALVKTLKEDSKDLQELTAKIKESAASLEKLAAVVEKATKMVELLIKAVAAGLSAGLV